MTTTLRMGFTSAGSQPDFPCHGMSVDEKYMSMALAEAQLSAGDAAPNPQVGCVIIQNNTVIARAATEAYGGLHGEAKALQSVRGSDRLHGATVYVTLEPCCHFGKQPPCTEALIAAGVGRVVIAIKDPNPKVAGGGIAVLKAAGIEVTVGVLANEAKAWHLPFLWWHKKNRPLLVGKWAQSLDGCLADDEGRSFWITGPHARAYGHRLRHRYDAIMVGAGTVLADCPSLTVRDYEPILRQPARIVVDPAGRLLADDLPAATIDRLKATTFSTAAPSYYLTSRAVLEERGDPPWIPNVIGIADHGDDPAISPQGIMAALADLKVPRGGHHRPIQSVYIEGGSRLLSWFAAAGMLDMLHTFIAPALIGGTAHKLRFLPKGGGEQGGNLAALTAIDRFQLLQSFSLGGDIVVESVVKDVWAELADL